MIQDSTQVRIVFAASRHWLGRLIRWLTNGKTSHAMLQFPLPLWGGDFIAQATFPDVRMTPAEASRKNVVEEFEYLFPTKAGFLAIRKLIGEWYDFRSLPILGWILIWRKLLGQKVSHPWHTLRAQQCSELIARFFQGCDLAGTKDWEPEEVTPEQLRRYCAAHSEYFRRLPR